MCRFGLLLAAAGVLVVPGGGLADGNADTVDLIHASATPIANRLLALDASKHFPSSVWGVPFTLSGTTSGAVLKGFNSSSAYYSSGVCGYSFATSGVTRGVVGACDSPDGRGVYGIANATSGQNYGVHGWTHSSDGYGVFGANGVNGNCGYLGGGTYAGYAMGSSGNYAWLGAPYQGVCAEAVNANGTGVEGECSNGSSAYGVWGLSSTGYAGWFSHKTHVNSTFTATDKQFKIDHPLDPENMYLQHACVESSERANVYSGNIVLDQRGQAWVELPDWFEALNCDFRYQLTAIGAPAPSLHIAREITDGCFAIAGGLPSMKVSWEVTGVRQDPYAVGHPMEVEVEKPEQERGSYLHPELYGMPEAMSVEWAMKPEAMMERHRDR